MLVPFDMVRFDMVCRDMRALMCGGSSTEAGATLERAAILLPCYSYRSLCAGYCPGDPTSRRHEWQTGESNIG